MTESLQDNFQYGYRQLLLFLGMRAGGYMFCQADDLRFMPGINNDLIGDLAQDNIPAKTIYLEKDSDEPLLRQIEQAAIGAEAVIVCNLFDIATNTENGRNNMSRLNFAREPLWKINKPILFWADAESLNLIANYAPDLFSQRRQSTVHFAGIMDVPVAEKLHREDWKTFLSSEQFNEIKGNINVLIKRLEGAKESNYPVFRTVSEIALPLALAYARLGLEKEARELLAQFESMLAAGDYEIKQQLAAVHHALHDYEPAISALQDANEQLAKKHGGHHPFEWHDNLIRIAKWSAGQGGMDAIFPQLAEAQKELAGRKEWSLHLSEIDMLMAWHLERSGKLPDAITYLKEALAIRQALVKTNPASEDFQGWLRDALERMGDYMIMTGNLPEARKYYDLGLEISRRLSAKDGQNNEYQHYLSSSLDSMGNLMQLMGNLQEAQKYYEQSLWLNNPA